LVHGRILGGRGVVERAVESGATGEPARDNFVAKDNSNEGVALLQFARPPALVGSRRM
jgi:hypothetical protein